MPPRFTDDEQFNRFWDAYPKRVSKGEALKAWAQLKPTRRTVDQMIEALAWQVRQTSWREQGGKWVPYPASWLRAQKWLDEPFEADRVRARSWRETCRHQPPCIHEPAHWLAVQVESNCPHDPKCRTYGQCQGRNGQ